MKNYASKLLLFGEHIVIKGARALAIPYPAFSGQWSFGPDDPKLQQNLTTFSAYLRDKKIKGVQFNLPAFDHQRIYCQINRKSGLGRRVTNPPGDSVGFACHDDLCGTLAV